MKILLLSVSMLLLTPSNENDGVYICVSKTASKYHLSGNCKGLSRCTHTVSKVTLKEAKNRGYSLCGWED
jgi:hypothetical protein